MRIDVLSIFPEMFNGPLTESLLDRARQNKIVDINIFDLRSFTEDKHHIVDDRPFGGGPGMILKPEPIYKALRSLDVQVSKPFPRWPLSKKRPLVIYLSPQGKTLNQKMVCRLSEYEHIVLLCGHYEGVDERVLRWVNQEISIGDYVLTGGELPSMVLIDSVVRLLPGVVKERNSIEQDSFFNGLLDFPSYTRPAKFKGLSIPKILLSGNHKLIEEWRKKQAQLNTKRKRPELLQGTVNSKQLSVKV